MIFEGSTGGRWIASSDRDPPTVARYELLAGSDDRCGHPVEEDPSVFRHLAPRYPGDECDHVGKCP